jgi:hypothetical protein
MLLNAATHPAAHPLGDTVTPLHIVSSHPPCIQPLRTCRVPGRATPVSKPHISTRKSLCAPIQHVRSLVNCVSTDCGNPWPHRLRGHPKISHPATSHHLILLSSNPSLTLTVQRSRLPRARRRGSIPRLRLPFVCYYINRGSLDAISPSPKIFQLPRPFLLAYFPFYFLNSNTNAEDGSHHQQQWPPIGELHSSGIGAGLAGAGSNERHERNRGPGAFRTTERDHLRGLPRGPQVSGQPFQSRPLCIHQHYPLGRRGRHRPITCRCC